MRNALLHAPPKHAPPKHASPKHASPKHASPRHTPPRRGRGAQRPRPTVAGSGRPVRVSDLILAMLSLTLLGALGLMAGAALLGRALGH